MITKVLFCLALFVSLAFAMQQGELAQEHSRKCPGHVVCTTYYAPCAIDCYSNYPTVESNIRGFINAINYNYNQLFGLMASDVVYQSPNGTLYNGVCGVTTFIQDQFVSGVYSIGLYSELVEVQSDRFAQVFVILEFLDQNDQQLYIIAATIALAKNVCGNWVQTIFASDGL